LNNRRLVRRSLVARKNIKRGDVFTEENLGLKRLGIRTAPDRCWDYPGRTADRDCQADEVVG
jgi:sialic acid synthase SpsE